MSWEERDRFLEATLAERRYCALFETLAKAGLRPGEAFALKPDDLDLRARTVCVERAVNLGQLKATKTYETRTVDLTADLARSLQRHLVWLRSEALRLGHGQPEWIFPNKA